MTWTGTPAASNAGGGYKEFPGLDAQIATGQKDAETGVLMPSIDSTIVNFGASVDSTTKDIVDTISGMESYLYNYAERSGLAPVTWAIVMRPELWFELSAIWPCRYLTDRCGNAAGTGVITINDDGNVRMRDDMRSGSYLLVNGRRYTVITDDGIAETGATGSYTSSIYFIPLPRPWELPRDVLRDNRLSPRCADHVGSRTGTEQRPLLDGERSCVVGRQLEQVVFRLAGQD